MRRLWMILPAFIYVRLVRRYGEQFCALGTFWNFDGGQVLVKSYSTTTKGDTR